MNISKKEKRLLVGQVVSNKMQKTVVVETERAFTHPVFHKIVRVTKKYKVHDENGLAKVGDVVEFSECRPLSKTKYMSLERVVNASSTPVKA